MKAILLTRESHFQIYCANKLLKQDLVCNVIVEDGTSVPDANQSKLKFVREVMPSDSFFKEYAI